MLTILVVGICVAAIAFATAGDWYPWWKGRRDCVACHGYPVVWLQHCDGYHGFYCIQADSRHYVALCGRHRKRFEHILDLEGECLA